LKAFVESIETMIGDLKAKVQAYRNALGRSVAERMRARTAMEDPFAKADGILEEEIDPAMELIRASKTQFYNEYFALRTRSTQLVLAAER
jgi:hypothetical protein